MTTSAADSAPEPKPKRLGGRPRKAPTEKLKSITTHVSAARYEELHAAAAEVRQPISQFVRPLVETGVKPRKRPTLQLSAEQEDQLGQLASMANNLNQLTKRAHQAGFFEVATQAERQLAALRKLLNYFADTV